MVVPWSFITKSCTTDVQSQLNSYRCRKILNRPIRLYFSPFSLVYQTINQIHSFVSSTPTLLIFFTQQNIDSEIGGERILWNYPCPLIITLILVRTPCNEICLSSCHTYSSDEYFLFIFVALFFVYTIKRTPYPPISCAFFCLNEFLLSK